ncbi:MAG: desulfoferrodoxin FeS4 iron-binding domain-containing protein [Desulfobacterales bacterium]
MTQKRQVFKCLTCGMVVAVLKGGDGELVCCGQSMDEVTPDEAKKLTFDLQRPGAP